MATQLMASQVLLSSRMLVCYLIGWWVDQLSNAHSQSSYKLSFTSSVLSSTIEACSFRTLILHHHSLNIMHNILSQAYSALLTADMILIYLRNPLCNS
jgi:hypothetical protein